MIFGILLLVVIYVLWRIKNNLQRKKRALLRDEMESLGKSNGFFLSPLCGKVTKILKQNGNIEIHIAPAWFFFQELRSPMDSEIINIKYFNPSKGLGKFWKNKKRRHLQIDLKIWFADPGYRKQEEIYSLICHVRWGSILPILNVGDLIRQKGKMTLSCNFKLIKIHIKESFFVVENLQLGNLVDYDTQILTALK